MSSENTGGGERNSASGAGPASKSTYSHWLQQTLNGTSIHRINGKTWEIKRTDFKAGNFSTVTSSTTATSSTHMVASILTTWIRAPFSPLAFISYPPVTGRTYWKHITNSISFFLTLQACSEESSPCIGCTDAASPYHHLPIATEEKKACLRWQEHRGKKELEYKNYISYMQLCVSAKYNG